MANTVDDAQKEKFMVSHGAKKYDIYIENPTGKKPILEDLANGIESVCGIPTKKQKIICKAMTSSGAVDPIFNDIIRRTLDEYNSTLSDLGISSKSKIMVIGKKNDPEEDKHIRTIEAISKQTDEMWRKFEEIRVDIAGLSQGFLENTKTVESYKKLTKKIAGLAEGFMKNIESLDALDLTSDFTVARDRRKLAIKKLNEYLSTADKEEERLNQLLASKM